MMCADAPSSASRAAALRAFLCAIKGGLAQYTGTLLDLGYSIDAFFAGAVDDASIVRELKGAGVPAGHAESIVMAIQRCAAAGLPADGRSPPAAPSIVITLLHAELTSLEGEVARLRAEAKAEANAASLLSVEAAAASRKELRAVQLAAEKRNRALAAAKLELEAVASVQRTLEAELAAAKAALRASDEARRVDQEQHALQLQEQEAALGAVIEAEEERAKAAEQRAAEAEADMAAEATRADAAEERAIAIEALLASELRSLDTDELSVCHDAMEGFWVMYDEEKSLVSRISSVC